MWTTPRTWVSGEVVTAAMLNLHVRDNLAVLHALVLDDVLSAGEQPTISVAGLGTTYRDLLIVASLRGAASSGEVNLRVQFNGDAAANYDFQTLSAAGAAAGASETLAATSALAGIIPAGTAAAGSAGAVVMHLPNFALSSRPKLFRSTSAERTTSSVNDMRTYNMLGSWRGTDPITSITLFSSGASGFAADSRVSVYGAL